MSGPFGSSQWMYASDRFYDHPINQSIRFSSVDGGFGEITYGSAGNRRTWSWSAWMKRSLITQSSRQRIWATQDGSGIEENIRFETDDQIRWICHNSDGSDHDHDVTTSAVFRDTSAWFHLLIVKDTTESTDSDRVKIYVNGSLQSFEGSPNYPSSNFEGHINKGQNHHIGSHVNDNSENFDGYMAEVHFIDGTAVSPSVLGETKAGIWIPKEYTGSHGTNGYHFTFADTSSNNALFNDDSANSNNFTSVGIVAGHDFMLDSPTNNFATLKLSRPPASSGAALSQGNLEYTTGTTGGSNDQDRSFVSTILTPTTGKWYVEYLAVNANFTAQVNAYQGDQGVTGTNTNRIGLINDGTVFETRTTGSATSASYGGSFTSGDVIQVFVDMDNDPPRVAFGKNGSWGDGSGNWNQSNPSSYREMGNDFLTDSTDSPGQVAFTNASAGGGSDANGIANFGQDGGAFRGQKGRGSETDSNGRGLFKYAVPSGGLALCTANLPSPGIDPEEGESPAEYFNTVLFTGNGTNQDIDVGFQPDLAFVRQRTDASGGYIVDSVRGDSAADLQTTNANAEGDFANITFSSSGYNVSGNNNLNNESSHNYVSWNWLAGGSASSNSDGSITSSVSVSQESGFSVVGYTGTGSNGTVGHGLGVVPQLIIIKCRTLNSTDWSVYHEDIGNAKALHLNSNGFGTSGSGFFNNTSPTSTVFSISTDNRVNQSASDTYIAYCFADIEGYQKIGSYKGNGNADGPVIITGFRPAFVICKRFDSANEWRLIDNKRDDHNVAHTQIWPNSSNAETTSDDSSSMDLLSNGFKLRSTNGGFNIDGGSYLYIAIAEQPFKFANAR